MSKRTAVHLAVFARVQFALKSIAHPLLMCPKYNTNVEIMTFKWLQPTDNNFLVGATVS